jgi:hypothetical protein
MPPLRAIKMAPLGTLSERAAMGHCTRRLQRTRHRVGPFSTRSCAQPMRGTKGLVAILTYDNTVSGREAVYPTRSGRSKSIETRYVKHAYASLLYPVLSVVVLQIFVDERDRHATLTDR